MPHAPTQKCRQGSTWRLLAGMVLALTMTAVHGQLLPTGADTLAEGFRSPPDNTKPYTYWYWLNNNASAAGVTADLEAMRAAGIGEAFIGHVVSEGIPEGSVPILGEFLRRIPADQRKGFQHITLDSYEVGPQNWTDDMAAIFAETYGYDPIPWLACLSGRVVASRDQTDRFLWDWRRLVADLIARNYVGGLKAAANRHGIRTWLENYGHWGFPGESLQYGGASDDIGGEYWLWSSLGNVECRLATSCANIYGKRVVSAEAFTSNRNFIQTPANMKTRGDWCLTEGVNHFVLHLYTHQPYDIPPGIVPWFGTDFNRHSTWFKEYGGGWIDYLRRCCHMLRQGTHAADVAYFFGEGAPCMNGRKSPTLPQGYDFDFINAEVLLTDAACRDGRLVLPHGQSYRVLALPPDESMTPELLRKLAQLVGDGLVLLGAPPVRSPSLKGYPHCDEEVRTMVAALWGANPGDRCRHKVGKGMVFHGYSLEEVFAALQLVPDVSGTPGELLWTHRTDKNLELYFLSNQSEGPLTIAPEFRVTGRAPEIWDAITGEIHETALYAQLSHATRVSIQLDPAGSCFVVFRKSDTGRVPIKRVLRNGEVVLSAAALPEEAPAPAPTPGCFMITALVTPGCDIPLPAQGPRGVHHQGQNFVVFPAHGNQWGDGHAGAGLSVGRNGVAAFEHWANNIAPVLVWRAPEPLARNTFVALVYRDGTPALYVDGQLVHTGTPSGQVPHLSQGQRAEFSGTLEDVRTLEGDYSAAAVLALAKASRSALSTLRPPWPHACFGAADKLELALSESGNYRIELANGTVLTRALADNPASLTLQTPWKVAFRHPGSAAQNVSFTELSDWKDHSDARIRYFSGTAVYETSFDWNDANTGRRTYLHLGDVRQMASITLNGKHLGVVWKKPFMVEIGPALRRGNNELRIEVVNTWHNRFVGDEQLPDDTGADKNGVLTKWPEWLLSGTPRSEAGRVTLATRRQASRETPLRSAGLLGPVTLFTVLP